MEGAPSQAAHGDREYGRAHRDQRTEPAASTFTWAKIQALNDADASMLTFHFVLACLVRAWVRFTDRFDLLISLSRSPVALRVVDLALDLG